MICSKKYRAVHHSGTRSMSLVKWIVMHSEEAGTAASAAMWFANPASEGSAHRCVDDKECYLSLPDNYIPWAAANSNTTGLHIEQAGWAAWSRFQWLKRLRTIRRAAKIAAHWCYEYDIPAKFVKAEDMLAGKKGITTHLEVSRYTVLAGLQGDHSHTDPGNGWPRRRFMLRVKARVAFLKARR